MRQRNTQHLTPDKETHHTRQKTTTPHLQWDKETQHLTPDQETHHTRHKQTNPTPLQKKKQSQGSWPDGNDVGKQQDKAEQVSVPGASKALKHNSTGSTYPCETKFAFCFTCLTTDPYLPFLSYTEIKSMPNLHSLQEHEQWWQF